MPVFQIPNIATVDPALFENTDLFGPIATQQRPSQLHAQAAALPPLIHGRCQRNAPTESVLAATLLPEAGPSVNQPVLSRHQVGQRARCECECQAQDQQLQSLLPVAGSSVIQPVLSSLRFPKMPVVNMKHKTIYYNKWLLRALVTIWN